MENSNLNYTSILNHFVVNSILTEKQTSIIYNKIMKSKPSKKMTSGAYYRQLGQCRTKIRKIVYTLLLLRLFSVLDVGTFSVLDQLNNQLNVMLNKRSDEIDTTTLSNVISLVDDVIAKLVLI
ncbi:MAG: hypothetical protein EHM34_01030 [Nitrosopumilales archaeon]|jgi:hypothetical protein|nr:MAG: hypothetical protein EHM34_01030 [Nitrosopumilales archaeon]